MHSPAHEAPPDVQKFSFVVLLETPLRSIYVRAAYILSGGLVCRR